MKALGLVLTVALLLVGFLPAAMAAQTLPAPHVFWGSVTRSGTAAPDGTSVQALVNGAAVATTTVSGETYVLRVQEPTPGVYLGIAVTFRVGNVSALESFPFSPFAATNLNLTEVVSSAPATLLVSASVPIAVALAPIAQALERVWHYDSAAQRWRAYEARAVSLSDLTTLERGKGYLIVVSQDVTLTTPLITYELARGLNMIGWLGN
ncbi:MAG: hypothetical protein EXR47_05505 [Dehalococcoidia bacterium]|nr:hypothetical protein [Dehalococcoidia bacterium]